MEININEVLFVIPARGGSKRLPKKNIKPLAGKPLICYSLDIARQLTDDGNICISTDSDDIISVVVIVAIMSLLSVPMNWHPIQLLPTMYWFMLSIITSNWVRTTSIWCFFRSPHLFVVRRTSPMSSL